MRFRHSSLRNFPTILICWLGLLHGTVSAEIHIDPSKPLGAKVAYFGWDLKGWQDNTSTAERARVLYGDIPANLVRIPIFAKSHASDGSIKKNSYGPMLTSIRNIRQLNSEVKIFASLKLLKENTFPEWVESAESGKIFEAIVQKPDPAKYARLLADYIAWLREEGLAIDFLGIGNETTGALSPDRYVETVHLLKEELRKRNFEVQYTSFKWVGPDSFGVPTALRFSRQIAKERGLDTVDIWGSHFYPDLKSGTIDDWEELAANANGKPLWHTELHVRNSQDGQNIAKIRDGLAIVFATNKAGVAGYVWWARAFEDGSMTNLIRRQVTKTLLGGSCVKTSGRYDAKELRPSAVVQQATRVGNNLYLWICNPGSERKEETVNLAGAEIDEVSGIFWQGPDTVGPTTQGELKFSSVQPNRDVRLPALPANSIALISFRLKSERGPDSGTVTQDVLVAEREWRSAAAGSKPIRAALLSIENGVGTFKRSDGSTFSYPLSKLDSESRRVAQEASERRSVKRPE